MGTLWLMVNACASGASPNSFNRPVRVALCPEDDEMSGESELTKERLVLGFIDEPALEIIELKLEFWFVSWHELGTCSMRTSNPGLVVCRSELNIKRMSREKP